MIKYLTFSICLFAVFVLCIPVVRAQDGGLNDVNIRAYYEYFEASNEILREGWEDIGIWLSFLEESYTDDYQGKSNFYGLCSDDSELLPSVGKDQLLDIYKTIGVNNYKFFQMDVHSIDVADDAMSAKVSYSIDLEVDSGEVSLTMHSDCEATHVWNAEKQKAQMSAQNCDERILEKNGQGDCSL